MRVLGNRDLVAVEKLDRVDAALRAVDLERHVPFVEVSNADPLVQRGHGHLPQVLDGLHFDDQPLDLLTLDPEQDLLGVDVPGDHLPRVVARDSQSHELDEPDVVLALGDAVQGREAALEGELVDCVPKGEVVVFQRRPDLRVKVLSFGPPTRRS